MFRKNKTVLGVNELIFRLRKLENGKKHTIEARALPTVDCVLEEFQYYCFMMYIGPISKRVYATKTLYSYKETITYLQNLCAWEVAQMGYYYDYNIEAIIGYEKEQCAKLLASGLNTGLKRRISFRS